MDNVIVNDVVVQDVIDEDGQIVSLADGYQTGIIEKVEIIILDFSLCFLYVLSFLVYFFDNLHTIRFCPVKCLHSY